MKKLFITLAIISSPVFAGQLPDLGSDFRSVFSVQEEKLIGEAMMQDLRSKSLVCTDPIINEYLSYIGNRLSPYAEMPYTNIRMKFFAVDSKVINAFAFFGGHIGVHKGLIAIIQSENELAGVMSHELAHVSQQHILRHFADSKRTMPLTIAGILASFAIGAPELMMPVMAGQIQHSINFTRQHEQEADRIGVKILAKANFDPQGLPDAFERMSHNLRYEGKPPEYLLTHPLYESRISDTRHRASGLSYKKEKYSSNMFDLIKARIEVQNTDNIQQLTADYKHKLQTKRHQNELSLQYGYAYALLQKGNLKEAWNTIEKIAHQNPDSLIIQLTAADIEAQSSQFAKAKNRLEQLLPLYSDSQALLLQYTELLLEMKQPIAAKKVLRQYKDQHDPEPQFYELTRQAEGMLGNKVAVYEANAEWYLLHGDIGSALAQLDLGLAAKPDPKTKHRIKTRQQEVIALEQAIKAL